MPTIRDTIDPTRERVVSDEEYLDLDRQGLVLTGTRARTPDGLHAAAVRQVLDRQRAAFDAAHPADVPTPADDGGEPDPNEDQDVVDDAVEDEQDPAPTDDPQES